MVQLFDTQHKKLAQLVAVFIFDWILKTVVSQVYKLVATSDQNAGLCGNLSLDHPELSLLRGCTP